MLLVDFDPQGSLSVGLGLNPHEIDLTIYNLLMQRDIAIEDVVVPSGVPGMDLLPSNIDLSAAEVQLVHEVAREQTLSRVLAPVIEKYDVILIDCQPSLGLLTVNALTASDGVIVPLECEYFALRGGPAQDDHRQGAGAAEPQAGDRRGARHHVRRRTLHGHEVMERLVEAWATRCSTHRHPAHREVLRLDRRRRADHDLRVHLAGCRRLPPAGEGGAGPLSRRVSLPAADDLFRPTEEQAADPGAVRTGPRRRPSGRVRHDEKVTIYVTSAELLHLEQVRLLLRAEHGVAVDRGRLVREAIHLVLAEYEELGDESALVRRLTEE